MWSIRSSATPPTASAPENAAAEIPPMYPNTWIRLVREDASTGTIKLYTSPDGATWTLRDTHTVPATDPDPAFPAKVLVGMAVTSHDNTGNDVLAEALYQSFSVAPYSPVLDPQLKVSAQARCDHQLGFRHPGVFPDGERRLYPSRQRDQSLQTRSNRRHDVLPSETVSVV